MKKCVLEQNVDTPIVAAAKVNDSIEYGRLIILNVIL